ncbi:MULTISPECIES: ABC transporter ATP-binding protein [Pseudomonas]|uniref:ABC transporter ATP-binding protein n=1 Tax=Pseudomonas citronellolis TaxID=53408 RepID=A0AAW6P3R7_9PSED|nr:MULTISPECIES: ABC transporter ATP-binding protein [Pseudomonas]KSW25360.1 ABC transporter [Pseudomonas sp. ADP]MDF3842316.1 ABC transporter ATP-binding protein [Pseudomonas citronellolis]OBP07248.1 ABC transporter [Pseudomonas sp. EGD-AKN5]QOF87935.1 ABC transporter ATP-binding protein [Pseudomonas sp. ADPe]WBG64980.1 ABC transporter ATP-binding protein [Pseudomonas citronellolis]
MSSDFSIRVQNLGKCYQIYDKPHHRLLQMLLGRFGKRYFREFWAMRDVSFFIPRGKVLGILGKNGAGKSTLLQMICATLSPTHGDIEVNGRVAALLELGSGFNPEFTGIENIYLNAQILGLTQEEVSRKLDDILAFADIGDFVHQPVKTYSSGMFARLAFSVAVNVEPDILIVDEALSVGDAWFQHKSMARMRTLMESGCTVLFVSHSIDAVRALCDEAIWLESGTIKMQGGVTEVTNAYMNDVFIEHNRITLQTARHDEEQQDGNIQEPALPKQTDHTANTETAVNSPSATTMLDGGSVLSVSAKRLRNSQGQIVDYLQQGESFSLEFELEPHQTVRNISVGFLIKDQFGQELTGESYFNTHRHSLNFSAGQKGLFIFKSSMSLRGGQSYSVALRVNQVSRWDRSDNVVVFADELAMVFDVLTDTENPMWFKFKMPFEVTCQL